MKKKEFKIGQIIVNPAAALEHEKNVPQLIINIDEYGGVTTGVTTILKNSMSTKVEFDIGSFYSNECELIGYTNLYQYTGTSVQGDFIKDKIYRTINPENINKMLSFIDEDGDYNGYSGVNDKKFIPVWPEDSYLEQLLSTKSNQNMKKENKLVGYKLSGKVSAQEVGRILSVDNKVYSDGRFFIESQLECSAIEKAKNMGVLDIWFIPVYDEDLVFKPGDFIYIENTGGRFSSHPEFQPIMNLSHDEYINKYKGVHETNVIEFIKYSSFSNCDRIIIGKMNGFYYAFDYTPEYEDHYRKATPEEIKQAKTRKFINKFPILHLKYDRVQVGCQVFSKDEINAFKRITNLIEDYNITLSPKEIIKLVTI